ncbi:phytase [Streptomyces resistomycificus]|uniref:phytase n=1 Tax=Streptomyces resistomycificus TaxID=67356 RepID=UPI0004AA4FB3|nr:phytase [Streptomyces resistomycificus]
MRTPRTARSAALVASATVLTTLLTAPLAGADGLPVVTPAGETAALYDDEAGGNSDADDPAIWRDPADPARSLVVATAKEGGLRVYDLDARQVQSLPAPRPPAEGAAPGRFNNVDLALGDPAAAPVFSADEAEIDDQRTAYGLATWKDRSSGRTYALVSRRERTTVALLELLPAANGTVGYRKVRTLDLPASFRLPDGTAWSPCLEPGELPQVEGMVVDPATGTLYAGQEDVGIWRLRADLTGRPALVDRVREYGVPGTYDEATEECVPGADPGYGGRRLSADVEGLTLLQERDGDGHLIASGQGDDTFALYDRELSEGNEYEGGFRIGAATDSLDGVEECDGAAVLNAPLGDRYPRGLLVVQDGRETPAVEDGEGGTRTATGFKFVDLGAVLDATGR